jgi:CheY-like chemotaxis protein
VYVDRLLPDTRSWAWEASGLADSTYGGSTAGDPMDDPRPDTADILVVDDDPGDVVLIQEAFLQADATSRRRCHVAGHATAALNFVHRAGEHTDAPRPRLILLDLNLAGTHGLEILAQIKADTDLMTIPVVILSSSRHPADIERSYMLHANAYIVKPVDLDAFSRVIGAIDACFLRFAVPSPDRQLTDHVKHADHPVLDSGKLGGGDLPSTGAKCTG